MKTMKDKIAKLIRYIIPTWREMTPEKLIQEIFDLPVDRLRVVSTISTKYNRFLTIGEVLEKVGNMVEELTVYEDVLKVHCYSLTTKDGGRIVRGE